MKIYIHPNVVGDDREKLEALLEEIGCEIVDALDEIEIETGACEEGNDEGDDDDEDQEIVGEEVPVCVVVLTPGLAEADLQPSLTRAVARGCRVIGIWGEGADGDSSPLGDYGADTVPWDGGRVRDAVCGVPQHKDPGGGAMPKPKRKHGGC
jgi:hypothetical protein